MDDFVEKKVESKVRAELFVQSVTKRSLYAVDIQISHKGEREELILMLAAAMKDYPDLEDIVRWALDMLPEVKHALPITEVVKE